MSTVQRGGRVFTDFSSWTSAHGVPHIGAASSKWMRIFWSVILVVSLAMFIMQLAQLIVKYLDYDVTVQTELRFEERPFPAVTICNINPYLTSKLSQPDAKDIKAAVDEYVTFKDADPDDTKDAEAQGLAREKIIYAAGQLSKEQRGKLSYRRDDNGAYTEGLIAACTFDQESCKPEDFTEFTDPIFGQCFTFNHNGTHRSNRAGPSNGLRVLAVSNQDEYLEVTDSVGVRVVVHGDSAHPFTDSFGFNAAAGFTTSFGIQFVEMQRLPAPHGNCTTMLPGDYPYGSEYSVEGCFRTCFQREVVKQVGCSSPKLAQIDDTPNCNYDKADEVSMVLNGSSGDLLSRCDCPQPCTEWSYSVTVSTALWPSSKFNPVECRTLTGTYPWTGTGNPNLSELQKRCTAWFRDNTMTVEIFYERMNYQSLRESAAYSLVNLVSDLGGQLGLWLGVSVITIIEFISLLLMCCAVTCGRKKVHGVDDDAKPSPFDGSKAD